MSSVCNLARVLYEDLADGLAPLYDVMGDLRDIDEQCFYGVFVPDNASVCFDVYQVTSAADLEGTLSPLSVEIEQLQLYGQPVGVVVSTSDGFAPEDQLPCLEACIYLTDLERAKAIAQKIGASEVCGISLPFNTPVKHEHNTR